MLRSFTATDTISADTSSRVDQGTLNAPEENPPPIQDGERYKPLEDPSKDGTDPESMTD